MKMHNFVELKKLLSEPKQIVIIPHRNPDGDAIGSTLAMNAYLTKLGHNCEVVSPNDFPKFLKWMEGAKAIHIAEYNPGKARKIIEKAELFFLLDFNNLSRIDELGEWVKQSKAPKVLIDHHQEPEEFEFMYSDTSVPATCQMVYEFIEAMENLQTIDTSIAECIYTGIMTDTGNFRYRNTGARTHRIVAELFERNIEVDKINSRVYDTQSEGRLKLLSLSLDSLKTFSELRTACMYLTREKQLKYGSQKGDTDGIVNYGLGIADCVFSAFFIEDQQNDFIKISFRSKGNFDVNTFARKHFNGGGHINAAGGRSDLSIEETIQKFEEVIQEYKEELINTII